MFFGARTPGFSGAAEQPGAQAAALRNYGAELPCRFARFEKNVTLDTPYIPEGSGTGPAQPVTQGRRAGNVGRTNAMAHNILLAVFPKHHLISGRSVTES